MQDDRIRCWLRPTKPEGGFGVWKEVTLEEFINAEQREGFDPTPRTTSATDGFSGYAVRGKITRGEITQEKYGDDPDFWNGVRTPLQASDALLIAS